MTAQPKARFSLLLITMMFCAPAANAETGGEMLSKCRPIAEGKIGTDGQVTFKSDLDTVFCWGAFGAIQGLSRFVDGSQRMLRICSPPDTRRSQFVAVFVEFVKKHPERWHEEFEVLAMDALSDAFPCNTSK